MAHNRGGPTFGGAGDETPRLESRGELLAIERGAKQVTFEREVLTDRPKTRQEGLRAPGKPEPSLAPLAFTRGRMPVFGASVHARAGLDEYVLHVRQFGSQPGNCATGR